MVNRRYLKNAVNNKFEERCTELGADYVEFDTDGTFYAVWKMPITADLAGLEQVAIYIQREGWCAIGSIDEACDNFKFDWNYLNIEQAKWISTTLTKLQELISGGDLWTVDDNWGELGIPKLKSNHKTKEEAVKEA